MTNFYEARDWIEELEHRAIYQDDQAAADVLDQLYLDFENYAAYSEGAEQDIEDIEAWHAEAEDAYQGEYGSVEEFAQDLVESTTDFTPGDSWLNAYIDWERVGTDLMQDYFEVDGRYFRA